MNNGNSKISRNNRAITKQNKMDDELSSLHGKIEGLNTNLMKDFKLLVKKLMMVLMDLNYFFRSYSQNIFQSIIRKKPITFKTIIIKKK